MEVGTSVDAGHPVLTVVNSGPRVPRRDRAAVRAVQAAGERPHDGGRAPRRGAVDRPRRRDCTPRDPRRHAGARRRARDNRHVPQRRRDGAVRAAPVAPRWGCGEPLSSPGRARRSHDHEARRRRSNQRIQRDDERLVPGLGVERGRARAEQPAPIPPSTASSADSARNWDQDVSLGRASTRAQPISPRRSSTLMTMMFAIPIIPTSSATATQAWRRRCELALGGGARLERVGRPRDLDAIGLLRVGGGRSDPSRPCSRR